MRIKNTLFFAFLMILVLLVSVFAHYRNGRRLIEKVTIEFEGLGAHFLDPSSVDKLLIQNKGALPWKAKDSLALSMLEALLESNPFIDNAEVFHFQQGTLGIRILEKTPMVKVANEAYYFLDQKGDSIPPSKKYVPNIPVFEGVIGNGQKKDLLELLKKIEADPFLRNELKSVNCRSNSFFIEMKSFGFEVEIGTLNQIDEKLLKLKVFCAYHKNQTSDKEYRLINLKFKNQVIGS